MRCLAIALPALGLALAVPAGCRRVEAPRPRNVVLVSVDTLRADHLGTYGYRRPTSPHIDALAAEATLFAHAVSTCPATAPSVAALLTGLHRASHGVFRNGSRLTTGAPTLAEVLKARGYRTAARVANPLLDAPLGFARGFDDFALPGALERAGAGMLGGAPVVEEARHLLDGLGDAPFFLWLHFMDPHGPYFPPEAYRARFEPEGYRRAGEPDLPIAQGNYGLHAIPLYQAVEERQSPADYRARYDAEIRYLDDHVDGVVRALRDRGLWDHTLFVLTADHGESLGEHDYYFQHGWFAYEDCLHVPLLIRAPGRLPGGRRVEQTVSLVDVAPTILDALGLPPVPQMEGRSLLPLVGGESDERPAFAQTYYGAAGSVALRRGRLAYIFTPPTDPARQVFHPDRDPVGSPQGREELYDLEADRDEAHDLSGERVEVVRALRHEVRRWLTDQQSRRAHGEALETPGGPSTTAPNAPDPRADRAIEAQLRALGYID